MKFKKFALGLVVILSACAETQEDRTAALAAAAKQPVPIWQSSSDGVDYRGRPLSGRSMVDEYLGVRDTQVSTGPMTLPFVAAGRYGQIYRIDGVSGTLGIFRTPNRFGSSTPPREEAQIIGERVAARTGCRWNGEVLAKYEGMATFAVFLDC